MMNIYLLMVIIILVLSRLFNVKDEKERAWFVNLSCFAMFVVMGFRDVTQIGNDSKSSYRIYFDQMDSARISKFFDFFSDDSYNNGFYLFMKICHTITGGDYQVFIIILSFIILLSFAFLIRKYSISPLQSFCYYWGLLYYTFMFSAEKQALAMSILVFSFDAALEKKPFRFLLLTFLAGWVHFPAYIFIFVYILAQMDIKSGYVLLLGLSLLITYLFRDYILKVMMNAYRGEEESYSMEGIAFFRNKVILMIIIFAAAMILRPVKEQGRLYKTLLLMMILAIDFQTFCGYNNIFERLSDYFYYYIIIFLPMLFEFPKQSKNFFTRRSELAMKWLLPLGACSFGIWRFLTTVNSDKFFTPYNFFF